MTDPYLVEIKTGFDPSWVAWSGDGTKIACGGATENAVHVYDAASAKELGRLGDLRDGSFHGTWSPDGTRLVILERTEIFVWEWSTGQVLSRTFNFHTPFVSWHPTAELIAVRDEYRLLVLDSTLFRLSKYELIGMPRDVAWSDDGPIPQDGVYAQWGGARTAAVAHGHSIRIVQEGRAPLFLEHHRLDVTALSLSHDGRFLASGDKSGLVAVFRSPEWNLVAEWTAANGWRSWLQFAPLSNTIAYTERGALVLRNLAEAPAAPLRPSVLYTTAKIALAGDSGVGKTGLGWVLTHDSFKEHPSTHGEQFWLAQRLSRTRADGTQCEAVVWDLAGQPDYRLIHSLFIDDADVVLVVFDPTNRQEPLKGAEFWLRALRAPQAQRCKTILVGARADRGTGILTDEEIAAFAESHGVSGGYIATSALTGQNVAELIARVEELVDWDQRPATVTLETFKHIKDDVLAIKEQERNDVLVTIEELQARLQERTHTRYSPDDIDTATRHLSNHGYVRHLRSSRGDPYVLLSPDLLNNLAASMILEARRNPRGLGALEERRVLAGEYDFPELAGLEPRDREILLDAASTLFIEHNICFRETLGSETYLVFPSLINQNKPPLEDLRVTEGTAYTATGATENVYASLVVLLGYTNTFTRTNQWRNQAQYEMGAGQISGFRLTEEREGEIDLVLYFGESTAPSTRQLFQGLFEKFLLVRDVEVQIFPPIECPQCRYAQPRSEVIKRQREGAVAMFCSNCGARVALPERILSAPEHRESAELLDREQRTAATRTQFEKAITWLKAYLRDAGQDAAPSCFISYARGDQGQERWVERSLATDLRNAGIAVVFDRWHNTPGTNISRFIEQIDHVDFVVMVGTPRLREKYNSDTTDPVVGAELELISMRLMKRSKREGVIPLLLEGEQATSFPPLAGASVFIDFRAEDDYFERMFDLLLTIYRIRFDEPSMRDLRDTIRSAAGSR
ncbi:MAG TPA: TIR domain-containing protein [Thermoanaerobaculia bacterium]|nr:TIR domain-containing protein [Thermoanaerobaculia bacterium]